MKSRTTYIQVFVAASALIILGVVGGYWSRLVNAASSFTPLAPNETIADAITYQGYLTDNGGVPVSGTYTMRFQIYSASAGGTLLWDGGNVQVMVEDGLFATRLAITTDIFNGEELWVAQTVNGELLTPRQEILPAPMAHTLRPGAIVKGTANAIPNNYVLDVQMNNDAFAFNRGAIFGSSTTGNAIQGLADSGRAIYGQTQDGYAIYGFDGGSSANRGYGGYFYSTNGVGVYGYSGADRSHPNILAPGVYGQSNRGVGVYGRGDTSNSATFFNEGGYFEGGKGLYARGTDPASQQGYGARIFSSQYRGMYVLGNGSSYDAYFGGNGGISTAQIVDRSASSRSLVVNRGTAAIHPGDLVAMVGVAPSPEGGGPMLAVARLDASNRSGVIGVAVEGMGVETVVLDDRTERTDFVPVSGSIAPDGFLVIVTDGLAPAVTLSSLNGATGLNVGDRIVVTQEGRIARAGSEADSLSIGRVAGPVDETSGTVPLFIKIN